MGVDVVDVERVIRLPRVNLNMIIQRIGRAARKSHMQQQITYFTEPGDWVL